MQYSPYGVCTLFMIGDKSAISERICRESSELWCASCTVLEGEVHSIRIYSGDRKTEIAIQVDAETPGLTYVVKEGPDIVGHIIATNNGLEFKDMNNTKKYSATIETKITEGLGSAADWLITIDSGSGFSTGSKFQYFSYKNANGDTVGKYFLALKNIDLSSDVSNKFDIRIAAVFSIFIDNAFVALPE